MRKFFPFEIIPPMETPCLYLFLFIAFVAVKNGIGDDFGHSDGKTVEFIPVELAHFAEFFRQPFDALDLIGVAGNFSLINHVNAFRSVTNGTR